MGWTSLHRDRGMTDREFFEREFPTLLTKNGHILDCATVHNVFYAAVQNHDDASYEPGRTFALVVMVRRYRGEYNFSYKEMDESMGPADAECPDRILDLLTDPPVNDYAKEWRARCRTNNATKRSKATIRAGETVQFTSPENLAQLGPLTRVDARKGVFSTVNGARYHISWWRRAQWETV